MSTPQTDDRRGARRERKSSPSASVKHACRNRMLEASMSALSVRLSGRVRVASSFVLASLATKGGHLRNAG